MNHRRIIKLTRKFLRDKNMHLAFFALYLLFIIIAQCHVFYLLFQKFTCMPLKVTPIFHKCFILSSIKTLQEFYNPPRSLITFFYRSKCSGFYVLGELTGILSKCFEFQKFFLSLRQICELVRLYLYIFVSWKAMRNSI